MENVRTFLSRAEERGGVPRFVERELLRFLECGIPAHGFVRVRCGGCMTIIATVMDPAVVRKILAPTPFGTRNASRSPP